MSQSGTTTQNASVRAPRARFPINRGLLTMLIAFVVLIVVSMLFAPSSVTSGTFNNMLKFGAVLAVAGLGQMLVIQQGGIDMSVPGAISLAVVLMSHIPNGDNSLIVPAMALAFLAAIVAGLVNALLVARLGLNSIIATLGVNALFMAVVLAVSGGTPTSSPSALVSTISSNTVGVSNAFLLAVLTLLIVTVVIKKTIAGRKFESVGSSVPTSIAVGYPVRLYRGFGYVGAQLLYTTAGIILTGITLQPNAYMGTSYLLTSVAVVVLAGTSLLGGKGFPIATVIAALFMSQLDQFTLALGVPYAAQTLVQAIALAVGVAIYTIKWDGIRAKLLRHRSPSTA
ncbi:MAG: ABC transporter permease [Gulosibacter sp.]|uniref:ABC transporter permease n=1 Tax=Gulosibacter sp. TaxID=2817531 RepID=UPI003F939F04